MNLGYLLLHLTLAFWNQRSLVVLSETLLEGWIRWFSSDESNYRVEHYVSVVAFIYEIAYSAFPALLIINPTLSDTHCT